MLEIRSYATNRLTLVIGVVALVLYLVSVAGILKKAGRNPVLGIVPFVGDFELWMAVYPKNGLFFGILDLVLSAVVAVLAVADFRAGLVGTVVAIALVVVRFYKVVCLNYSFRKGTLFFLGLLFLWPLFMPILAFGPSEFYGDEDPVSAENDSDCEEEDDRDDDGDER